MSWHQSASFVKSMLRIIGCVCAGFVARDHAGSAVCVLALFFLLAEGLGLAEEIGEP